MSRPSQFVLDQLLEFVGAGIGVRLHALSAVGFLQRGRLRYKGPYADIRDAYRWLFGVWLPGSGHEEDDAQTFEAYLNDRRDTPFSPTSACR